MRWLLAALALSSSWLLTRPAAAQDDPAGRTSTLSWVRLPGAERCATAQVLARAVEARLDRPVFVAPRDADLSVEGRVAVRDEGGYVATFAVATAEGEVLGERELATEAEDCAELTETVAFVVAVMIDPEAEAETETDSETETETDSETETETDSETVPADHHGEGPSGEGPRPETQREGSPPTASGPASETETETDTVTDTAPSPNRFTVEIDLGAGLAVGLLPEPAVGGFGAVVLQTPWLVAFEIDGSVYPYSPQSTAAGDANWLSVFGGLLVCTPKLEAGGFGLRGCAGGELGFHLIHGPAADPAQTHVAGQVLVRARLSYRVWKGLVVWTRPTVAFNPRSDPYVHAPAGMDQTLHTPETVLGIFDLGVGWVFD